MKPILIIIAVTVGALAALGATFMVGMRRKTPFVINTQRRINKAVLNPRQMKRAGQPGSFAGVIEHVGRNSGSQYETPIGFFPIDDGFLVTLPYGTSPDWLKNLMAAGSATVRYEGETLAVNDPQIVSQDVAFGYFPESEKKAAETFNITEFLIVSAETPESVPTE